MLALGVPLVIAVGVQAYHGYLGQLEQIKRTQSVQSFTLAAAVDANLQREVKYVARLYATAWPRDRLRHLAEELEIAVALFPSILQVTVERAGQEMLFVSQLDATRVGADEPSGAASEKPEPVRYSVSRLGQREIPAIVARIPNERRAGEALLMVIDLRTVSDLLREAGRRDSSVVYLVGEDGSIVAHSDPAWALSLADVSAVGHVKAARERDAEANTGLAMESLDRDGRTVLATVLKAAETRWLVVMERPLAEVFAPIRVDASRTLLILAGGLVAAILVGAGLAHRFTGPILTLGKDVERIGRGDLAHRTAITTGDEIQRLAGQVNEMADRLEDYTHGLERKVDEKTAALREAMRSRELFLAAASHDLRQPLYAISILADAMALKPLPADAQDVLSKQRQAIGILRSLFDNLLDLSRFEAGEVRVSLRDVSLREVLAPTAVEFEVLSHAKGLEWKCSLADVSVRTDPELLRRLTSNLLSNAVRYTQAGSVSISTVVVGECVEIRVSDTGIGIPREEQQRVFQEFVQLENPARERERGVGLGLSIVRKINELLDAGLVLDSTPGQGTSVTFRIPVSEAAAGSTPEPAAAPVDFAGARVWVVEDDPLVRSALAVQLDEWAVDHDFAVDRAGILALRQSDGEWPAVIILDDMLGKGERGLEIATWLRDQVDADRIILATGNVEPSRVRALQESGLKVLRKPIASAVLAQALHDALRAAREAPAGAHGE